MRWATLVGLFLGVGALACNKAESDSVVVVSVTAPDELPPIMKLKVVVENGGQTDVEYFPDSDTLGPINFKPAATFALTLPRSRSGDLDVVIDALDAGSNPVAHGQRSVTIVVGGKASVSIALVALGGPDGGVGSDGGEAGEVGRSDGSTAPDGRDASTGRDTGAGGMGGGGTAGGAGGRGGSGGAGGAAGDAAGAGGRSDGGGTGGMGGADAGLPTDVPGTDTPTLVACGDGVLGGSETCDDGNTLANDGCSSACRLEPGASCPMPGRPCVVSTCGNGKTEPGERCDCGTDSNNLPSGCKAPNGLFYGDGQGCSKTCTAEPLCLDASGKTQACTTSCGDGNVDPGEACDDGNGFDGDGCSSKCVVEEGFTCATQVMQDSTTCQSGTGQCLRLPIIYRDFQAENVTSGGHPDFPFLGTKFGGSKPTTICVPASGGPAKGYDSTTRCWGIMADSLLRGKPQPGPTKTCACQFSDWNMGNSNSSRIPGGYTMAGNDSPLSDASGGIQGGNAGTTVNTTSTGGPYTGTLTGFTSGTPGGPIWKGTAPAYKDAASFNQWFNDDPSVNRTFTGVLELASIGSNIYQYASKSHLAQGGFFPLDQLNPSQATLCNLWPYWNHGSGQPFWTTCSGDQYLFIPRVTSSDCVSGDTVDDGCWVTGVQGVKHDSYFTDETRYYFVYDGAHGLSLSFYGDDDLFIFINGVLVLDLGGIHPQLPGKVTVQGDPGDAHVVEGGCVDAAGNQIGASAGSTACSPGNVTPALQAATPADFRDRTVKLGLQNGRVYEIAIFGADRHPPESNYQLTLQGFTTKRSVCSPI
jgi:cysteine-rich repeat protein